MLEFSKVGLMLVCLNLKLSSKGLDLGDQALCLLFKSVVKCCYLKFKGVFVFIPSVSDSFLLINKTSAVWYQDFVFLDERLELGLVLVKLAFEVKYALIALFKALESSWLVLKCLIQSWFTLAK